MLCAEPGLDAFVQDVIRRIGPSGGYSRHRSTLAFDPSDDDDGAHRTGVSSP